MSERPNALLELVLLRLRLFLREPEALFWTFGFPIVMALGLGLAFGGEGEGARFAVAVERGSAAERQTGALRSEPRLEVSLLDPPAGAAALRRGEIALLIGGADTVVFRYDPARQEALAARLLADRALQHAAGATRPLATVEDAERSRGGRYIDWVIPGLIGLNLMSTGMWGLGFGIVQMRQKKQLKRLVSTPMRKSDFLLSQIIARLLFVVLEVPPIVLFAYLAFGVGVAGSGFDLAVVVLLGSSLFAGLGLLSASRARTVEGVSGIVNLVMLPMFVLSGVFFSAERFPDAIQPAVQALPLTALNDALRAVYNEGLPISAIPGELTILAVWTLLSFVLALRLFRWQ